MTTRYRRRAALRGAARLMEWNGSPESHGERLTSEQRDWLATASDWNAVGEDLISSMAQVALELPPRLQREVKKTLLQRYLRDAVASIEDPVQAEAVRRQIEHEARTLLDNIEPQPADT